jgi:hypothetical protein
LENDHGEILEATEVQPVDERHMVHDVDESDVMADSAEDGFIVELDESHVISTAIN